MEKLLPGLIPGNHFFGFSCPDSFSNDVFLFLGNINFLSNFQAQLLHEFHEESDFVFRDFEGYFFHDFIIVYATWSQYVQ